MRSLYVGKEGPAPKQFTPLYKMVCVQLITDGTGHKEGDIIIPEISDWRSIVAKVIAVGPKCEQVKEGDTVTFSPAIKPQIVRYGGYETLLIHEEQLQGVVEVK